MAELGGRATKKHDRLPVAKKHRFRLVGRTLSDSADEARAIANPIFVTRRVETSSRNGHATQPVRASRLLYPRICESLMVTPKDSGGLPAGFSRFWWGEAVSGFGGAVTLLVLLTLVVVTLQGSAVRSASSTRRAGSRTCRGWLDRRAVVRLAAKVQPSVLPAVMIEYPVSMGLPAG
jgi:hypothetical protein